MSTDRERAAAYAQVRRNQLGMSQQRLADTADLDIKTVNNLETGKHWPRAKNLARLDRALELKPGGLQAAAEGREPELLDAGEPPGAKDAVALLCAEITDLEYLTDEDWDMLHGFWSALVERARELNRDRASQSGQRRKGA